MAQIVCKTNVFSLSNRISNTNIQQQTPTHVSLRSKTSFYGRRFVVAAPKRSIVVTTRRKASNLQVCYYNLFICV